MNYLLVNQNDIVYSEFSRATNPLILIGEWNWSAASNAPAVQQIS